MCNDVIRGNVYVREMGGSQEKNGQATRPSSPQASSKSDSEWKGEWEKMGWKCPRFLCKGRSIKATGEPLSQWVTVSWAPHLPVMVLPLYPSHAQLLATAAHGRCGLVAWEAVDLRVRSSGPRSLFSLCLEGSEMQFPGYHIRLHFVLVPKPDLLSTLTYKGFN